jgi:hypothetical protein
MSGFCSLGAVGVLVSAGAAPVIDLGSISKMKAGPGDFGWDHACSRHGSSSLGIHNGRHSQYRSGDFWVYPFQKLIADIQNI